VLQASSTAAQGTGPDAAYWRFHDAVARAQLSSWLAGQRRLLIDISGPASVAAALATSAGHKVLRVTDPRDAKTTDPEDAKAAAATAAARPGGEAGQLRTVAADASGLQFLADGCADGLIAEDRTLSRRLAAEALVSEICRVLRPGGRVLASVDSLTRGMSVLAEQNHWPHLIDLPHADVVLVPWPDGIITRCYGTEQLRELFTSAGFAVSWIRPRTVLSASTVSYLLARDPASFPRIVEAELRTSADDSVGGQLVISATKRRPG
jgi:SAM-dependent methyltransferase